MIDLLSWYVCIQPLSIYNELDERTTIHDKNYEHGSCIVVFLLWFYCAILPISFWVVLIAMK